ncbi:MAG: hypothetical protein ACRC1L_03800 [Prochlorococcaceae cyanobacterium]
MASIARPLPRSLKRSLALGLASAGLLALAAPPAQAQRVVTKIGNICPLGYVDMLNGKCSTLGLMNYTVQPTNGQACPEGWMNVGGRYCRKK